MKVGAALMKVVSVNTSWIFPLIVLMALAPAVRGEDADEWAVSLGGFDLADTRPPEVGLEYRLPPLATVRAGALVPALGLSGTSDGNAWIYAALRFDWRVSERWTVTPQFGASLYEAGDGKDLGGLVEFRSGLELTYRFDRGTRLGFVFYHLSNARIYDDNPGSNSIVLTYGFGR